MIAGCALGAVLAACSGTTGSSGGAGPAGPAGPSGPSTAGTARNVSAATTITGTITGVAISGPPVVKFQLADQDGTPLQGLTAASLGRRGRLRDCSPDPGIG
jgi:hypothetical protein